MALADGVGQPQQADEHGRHHVEVCDLFLCDQTQEVFRVELRL